MGAGTRHFLGRWHLSREITAFEAEVFVQFAEEEVRIIDPRRRPALKWGLALPIGFLRMNGRLLDAVRMVPPPDVQYLGMVHRTHKALYCSPVNRRQTALDIRGAMQRSG